MLTNTDINYQPQPGYKAGFPSPWGYCHWGIISNIDGSDGKHQVIAVNKTAGKVYKQNFSEANKHQNFKVSPVENAREVCQRAELCIGENWSYDLLSNNCEHFVSQIATGRRQSGQVRDAIIVIGAIGGVFIGKQQNLSGMGIVISMLIGAAAGVMVNNEIQQGGTQMRHQPRV